MLYDGFITDVPGIRVGNASNLDGKTGVTVVLVPPQGVAAGIHKGGSAPSTRQADSLEPLHIVDRIHAVCLCGGSAFGLDAAGGVLRFLESHGVGFHYGTMTIPIVPAAAIFDLNFGSAEPRPDASLGIKACESSSDGPVEQGSVGAGTGATVGKLYGIEQAMKGGLGTCSVKSRGDLIVGALVVVNAYGDIWDSSGKIIAGARTSTEGLELADAARLLHTGQAESRKISVENTTLAIIGVNAKLDKIMASRVAAQSTTGLARVIRPFHSHVDGDATIVLSLGEKTADPNTLALMAAEALQGAVINAVTEADGFGLVPAFRDLNKVLARRPREEKS